MPNKTNDWLDDLLDRHPAEPVPSGFAERVQQAVADERSTSQAAGPKSAANLGGGQPHQTTFHRFARPLLTMAAAALLVSLGFMMGAGAGPDFQQVTIGNGGSTASTDPEIDEIYQVRELLDSWELMSDSDLEMSFRQLNEEDSDWLDELLVEPGADDGANSDGEEGADK